MWKDNLIKARSTIVFILALIVGFLLVTWIERTSNTASANAQAQSQTQNSAANGQPQTTPTSITFSNDLPAPRAPRALEKQELEWARIAWQYFEKNTDPKTGLANSVDNYQAATMWDTASYLLALISAQRLEIIPEKEFDARLEKALASLAELPLYDKALPNKSYSTANLQMVNYAGQPTETGIGWSAIDVGRLLVPLNVIVWAYPQHTALARKVIARWDTNRIANAGTLFGVAVEGDKATSVQEGRLGYEQYAAKTFGLMGLDVHEAMNYRSNLAYVDVYGIQVPHDRRDPKQFGARNFVVSEPYMLDGLEFGWDAVSREFAWRVYRAQEERFKKTGVLTAVSEDHIDRAPYFVYNSVFSDGKVWNAITEKGEDASNARTLSTKTAFAWHALYGSDYTARLVSAVAPLHDPERGWYAGLYEEGNVPNKVLTANTNAVVLESLAYIAHGKFISYR